VTSTTTLLDVGRRREVCLPLALRCKHVTAVEPSPSMVRPCVTWLRRRVSECQHRGGSTGRAEVEPADVVLSAHVIYSLEDIGFFVMKLAAHARQQCACHVHASAARPLRSILALGAW